MCSDWGFGHTVEERIQFVDELLNRGADLEARDEDLCSRPIVWAARYGHTELVQFLIERGAKVESADDPAWATPIAWARKKEHTAIEELLKQT
ncbi:MAG: hypothetical protein CMJ78_10225 [Planctomycetaceae bacterium]|nr:hypothetical protein [Planctomycetaceae bacterium]